MNLDNHKVEVTTHQQYVTDGIKELDPNPLTQFAAWFKEAQEQGAHEPEAMTVSSVSSTGIPSSRVVLLKQVDNEGFIFFTNYESRKGQELLGGPAHYVALSFYWPTVFRQVRVVGYAEKTPTEVSKAYFDSRPLGSRIGAWSSPQSKVLASREELEQHIAETKQKLGINDATPEDTDVPLPPFWGGIRIVPIEIEFWMGRLSRLHDRFVFKRSLEDAKLGKETWETFRLSP